MATSLTTGQIEQRSGIESIAMRTFAQLHLQVLGVKVLQFLLEHSIVVTIGVLELT